jgi:hypothetical protein
MTAAILALRQLVAQTLVFTGVTLGVLGPS